MAGDAFLDGGFAGGLLDGVLEAGGFDMVPAEAACRGGCGARVPGEA
jgi:hypothetical protein